MTDKHTDKRKDETQGESKRATAARVKRSGDDPGLASVAQRGGATQSDFDSKGRVPGPVGPGKGSNRVTKD